MEIKYCNDYCLIGNAAKTVYLDINSSAYDAAMDFNFFVENCFKTCPFKLEHNKIKDRFNKYANV